MRSIFSEESPVEGTLQFLMITLLLEFYHYPTFCLFPVQLSNSVLEDLVIFHRDSFPGGINFIFPEIMCHDFLRILTVELILSMVPFWLMFKICLRGLVCSMSELLFFIVHGLLPEPLGCAHGKMFYFCVCFTS